LFLVALTSYHRTAITFSPTTASLLAAGLRQNYSSNLFEMLWNVWT